MFEDDLQEFAKKLEIRNYGPMTIKTYVACLNEYFEYVGHFYIEYNESSLRIFLSKKQSEGKTSQEIELYLSAIKFFYHHVYGVRGFGFRLS